MNLEPRDFRQERLDHAKELLRAEGYYVIEKDRVQHLTQRAIIPPYVGENPDHVEYIVGSMSNALGAYAYRKGLLHKSDSEINDEITGRERVIQLTGLLIKPREPSFV